MPTLRSTMKSFLQDWQQDVAPAWRSLLSGVEPDFEAIDPTLQTTADDVVFPGRKGAPVGGARADSHVFRALDGLTPQRVRAVVVGQDPYPEAPMATGRAFDQGDLETWSGPNIAPSLRRVLQETAHFRNRDAAYRRAGGWQRARRDVENGDPDVPAPEALFNSWQHQGVLLLNTGLTLTRFEYGGHPHQMRGHIPMWAPVVAELCLRLAQREDTPVVFLAWGGKAREFLARTGILRSKDRPIRITSGLASSTAVVERAHPVDYRFFGRKNLFEETNEKLEGFGVEAIAW